MSDSNGQNGFTSRIGQKGAEAIVNSDWLGLVTDIVVEAPRTGGSMGRVIDIEFKFDPMRVALANRGNVDVGIYAEAALKYCMDRGIDFISSGPNEFFDKSDPRNNVFSVTVLAPEGSLEKAKAMEKEARKLIAVPSL